MRKSRGRQKVEMVKMPNESNLQVTFSKRRSGLFKKASELCTLCGAEIAIIVFSPGKKVFSFGHPCVEALIERFVTRNPPPSSGTLQLIEAHRNANVRELNAQLTQVLNQLEMERKRSEELNKLRKASQVLITIFYFSFLIFKLKHFHNSKLFFKHNHLMFRNCFRLELRVLRAFLCAFCQIFQP